MNNFSKNFSKFNTLKIPRRIINWKFNILFRKYSWLKISRPTPFDFTFKLLCEIESNLETRKFCRKM